MFDSIINLLIKGFEGLHNVVFNIIPNVNLSYGLTIILAIIIIKVITLPLHIKQIKTTKVLQTYSHLPEEMMKLANWDTPLTSSFCGDSLKCAYFLV